MWQKDSPKTCESCWMKEIFFPKERAGKVALCTFLAPDLDHRFCGWASDLDQRFSMMPLAELWLACRESMLFLCYSKLLSKVLCIYTVNVRNEYPHLFLQSYIYIYVYIWYAFSFHLCSLFHRSCFQVALLSHHNSLVESGDSGFARWPGPTMVALGWGPAGSCSQMWLGHQLLRRKGVKERWWDGQSKEFCWVKYTQLVANWNIMVHPHTQRYE